MNSFGRIFRVTLFGESHGPGVGVVIDGIPAGIPLSMDDFKADLDRRKSGAPGTTARKEADIPEILSGVYEGKTSGAPVAVLFRNEDGKSSDYHTIIDIPRPGHADFTARTKFLGFNDPMGGGHFSGRLSLALVTAGVIARKIVAPVSIHAEITKAGGMKDIGKALDSVQSTGDSLGGVVECVATNLPIGWGEPFFDSVESLLSHLVFAIPAIKGIEFGSGFRAAGMKGSEHNDALVGETGKTATNHAGGINGGITNGNDLVFRVAVKPTSSISVPQKTFNLKEGAMDELVTHGRHDTCVALRMPVILEAATAIVLADLKLTDLRMGVDR